MEEPTYYMLPPIDEPARKSVKATHKGRAAPRQPHRTSKNHRRGPPL